MTEETHEMYNFYDWKTGQTMFCVRTKQTENVTKYHTIFICWQTPISGKGKFRIPKLKFYDKNVTTPELLESTLRKVLTTFP